MSPLWSDMALARAAWAKAEDADPGISSKSKPLSASGPVRRSVRHVLRPRLTSFAL